MQIRTSVTEKTDITLKRVERQGYVMKKVDRPPTGQDGDQTITWHIGPRAKEEVGFDGVMGLVQEVYGESSEDLDKKLHASLGIKKRPAEANGRGDDGHAAGDANAEEDERM